MHKSITVPSSSKFFSKKPARWTHTRTNSTWYTHNACMQKYQSKQAARITDIYSSTSQSSFDERLGQCMKSHHVLQKVNFDAMLHLVKEHKPPISTSRWRIGIFKCIMKV
ncbi:hypothetical protein AMTRI_Chr09g15680 [Amborella trichopoda]